MKFIAAFLVAAFGFAFQVVMIYAVVFVLISHTDLNNWFLALAAFGTLMVTGYSVGLQSSKAAYAIMA